MWFSEDLNPTFSTAYVVNAAKSAANVQEDVKTHVDKGDAHVSTTDSREMDVSLKPNLPSAVYVILYRTQSAQDGHILYGSFLFIVEAANGALPTFNGRLPQQGAFSGSGNSNGQLDGPTLFSFIMISLVDLGAVFWVGAQLWRIFVISELQSEDQQVIVHQMEQRFDRHFSWSVLLLILLANIGVLVGQALTLTSGQWGPALAPTLLASLIARGQFGAYWIMREIVTLVALVLSISLLMIKHASQRATSTIAWAHFALGMALLIALTLSGHAAATNSTIVVYAVLADFLHLLAAALWVGGMLFLAVIYLPLLKSRSWQHQTTSLLSVLPRYSPLAMTGVVLMALSGPFNAATRLVSWDQLMTTAYGRALVVKVLLVGAMLLTSAVHVFIFRPRLAKDLKTYQRATQTAHLSEEDEPTHLTPMTEAQTKELEEDIAQQTQRLSTVLRWEPALGVVVLLCTGLLAVFSGTLQPIPPSQPASQPQRAPSKPFTTTVKTTDQQFRVMVKVDPNHFGTNTFTATVTDSKGKPVPTSSVGVSLYTTMLDMNMGTDVVNLQPDGKGHFSASGDLSMGGNWQVRIEIRTLDATLHEATVKFFTPF